MKEVIDIKIYVVTTGCYSDYCIDKVFTDKEKAEEYAEWVEDSRVAEYETCDEIDFNKNHRISITLEYHDNHKEDIYVEVDKTTEDKNECSNYNLYTDYHGVGGDYFSIGIERIVNDMNFNEEFYKNKFTKVAYDMLAIVKQKINEGCTEEDIREILEQ